MGALSRDTLLARMPAEVRLGLLSTPRELPSKYFYDETGSELFERITELPEYYLTRVEHEILENSGGEIARLSTVRDLIELGSGSAKKTRLLIEAGLAHGTLKRYIPVEVSREFAERSARALAADYPALDVRTVVGDFERHLARVPEGRERLVVFLGSTIGNFSGDKAASLLRAIRALLDPSSFLLLGVDLVKDTALLEAAYNDSQGVTARFNRNILNVINGHLGGDFDPEAFEHVARYNESAMRIESYLRSIRRQTVRLAALEMELVFEPGEEMLTEVSCKHTRESLEALLAEAGLSLAHWFTDSGERFALALCSPAR